jgi:ABC-type polysaccharide/polyol phosphate export permease
MLLISIYGISLTLFTSTLQTKWRDVNQFVVVAVRIGFYFSPVFYTMQMLAESRIPPDYLTAYLLLNPIAVFLTMARSAFTSAPLGVDTWIVIASIIHVLILYVAGSYWFRKNENEAVKYL